MARTEAGAQLTQRHRLEQLSIRASALRDLLRLWGTVDPFDVVGTVARFALASAVIIRARRRDSATAAVEYVADFRRAEGARGALALVEPEPPPVEHVAALVRGAGISGVVSGRQRGFAPESAARNGFVRVAGTSSNLVLAGGREVITEATASDRASTGRYLRVASPDACAFCRMLASRGPAFSADTSTFDAHPGCSCWAEEFFEGSQMPDTSQQFRREWNEAQRHAREAGELRRGTTNDALNAYRRFLAGQSQIEPVGDAGPLDPAPVG